MAWFSRRSSRELALVPKNSRRPVYATGLDFSLNESYAVRLKLATYDDCFFGMKTIKQKPTDRSVGSLRIRSFYELLSGLLACSLLACGLLALRRRLRLDGLLGLAAGRLLSLAASGLLRDGLLDGLLGRSLLLSLLRSHVVFVLSFLVYPAKIAR